MKAVIVSVLVLATAGVAYATSCEFPLVGLELVLAPLDEDSSAPPTIMRGPGCLVTVCQDWRGDGRITCVDFEAFPGVDN